MNKQLQQQTNNGVEFIDKADTRGLNTHRLSLVNWLKMLGLMEARVAATGRGDGAALSAWPCWLA